MGKGLAPNSEASKSLQGFYLPSEAFSKHEIRKAKLCFYIIFVLFFFTIVIIASPVNAEIRIMPLGDSITRGSSSGESDGDYMVSYRKPLWDLLVLDGYEVDFVGSQNEGSEVFGDSDLADHEGHGGWRDDEIVNGRPGYGKLEDWLIAERPNIVLLHIGTNGLDPSPNDVKDILDLIDNHESNFGEAVWVILARIINRNFYSQTTTDFNDNVEFMAYDRIDNPNNPAYPDKIIIVDMEDEANINYDLVADNPPGDMWDNLHPFETGYEKMADVWFDGLQEILPVADAGPNQAVRNGDLVRLDGSNSYNPDGAVVSYYWAQSAGPPVTLSNETSRISTFIAPSVGFARTSLKFELTVTDNDGLEHSDFTTVDVNKPSISGGGGGGGGCFITTIKIKVSVRTPGVPQEFRSFLSITNPLALIAILFAMCACAGIYRNVQSIDFIVALLLRRKCLSIMPLQITS